MKRIHRIGPLVKSQPFTLEGVGVSIIDIGHAPGQPDLYAWVVESLERELATPQKVAYLLVLTGDDFEAHWHPIRTFIDQDGFEWHLLRYFPEGQKSIY